MSCPRFKVQREGEAWAVYEGKWSLAAMSFKAEWWLLGKYPTEAKANARIAQIVAAEEVKLPRYYDAKGQREDPPYGE